jgi:peptidoglycan hydrolase-like protein with peptidoglycan-binding domain
MGFDVGPAGVDGRFGPLTAGAVRRMQHRYGLVADAIVGRRTRRVIGAIVAQKSARRHAAPDRRHHDRSARHPATPASRVPPAGGIAQRSPQGQPTATRSAPPQRPQTAVPTVVATIAIVLAISAISLTLLSARDREAGFRAAPIAGDRRVVGPEHDDGVASTGGRLAVVPTPAGPQGKDRGGDDRHGDRSLSLAAGDPVIGYVCGDGDPTAEPEWVTDLGAVCSAARWTLQEVVHDEPTVSALARPGLTYALQKICAGQARALVVSDIERLTPTLTDLGALLERFRDADSGLVIPELHLDTTTDEGRQAAATLITLSGLLRDPSATRPGGHLTAVENPDERGRAS